MSKKLGRPRLPISVHLARGTYRADRHGPKPAPQPPVIPLRFGRVADQMTGAQVVAAIESAWQVDDPIARAQLQGLAAAIDRRQAIRALLDGPAGLLARLGAGEVGLSAKAVEVLLKGEHAAADDIQRALDSLDLEAAAPAVPKRVAR